MWACVRVLPCFLCIKSFPWLMYVWVWRYEHFQAFFWKENTRNIIEKHWGCFSALAAVDRMAANILAKTQNMTTMWHVRCKIQPVSTFSKIRPVVPHKCFPSLSSLRCFLLFYIFSFCNKAPVKEAAWSFDTGGVAKSYNKRQYE